MQGGEYRPSELYVEPAAVLSKSERLTAAPDRCDTLRFDHGGLAALRSWVRIRAGRAFLHGDRVQDLLIAVSEAASNTLTHTDEGGILRGWHDTNVVVCEVSDRGYIVADHLAGRLAPPVDAKRGRGLWLINQLCDLVELRSSAAGTIIRMHMHVN